MKFKLTKLSITTLLVVSCSIGLIAFKKYFSNGESDSSYSSNETGEQIFKFEKKDIKMKNVGDTCTLNVVINENATYKTCTFVVGDESSLEIVKKTATSITLKKVKKFEDFIVIKAISNDPFTKLEDECKIRSYNNLNNLFSFGLRDVTDASGQTSYKSLVQICDEDAIILKKGLKYTAGLIIETDFSYLNGETMYEGDTYVYIEDNEMNLLKTSLASVFNNEIISFEQNLYEFEANQVYFSFIYENEISFNETTTRTIQVNDKKLDIVFTKYVANTSFSFNENSSVI